MKRSRSAPLLAALAASLMAADQVEFPLPSQPAVIKQRVGLTDIEISYSRPNKNGREIFGAWLPYGEVWRTGANSSTKIKFSDTVKLGDTLVSAGEYALYTIPQPNEWTIILSKDTKGWGAYEYEPENDVARIVVTPTALTSPLETFEIGFSDLRDDSAVLYLAWDQVRVPVRVTTPTVETLDAKIAEALKNPDKQEARFWFNAASFYLEHDRDLEQASKWINLACEQKPTWYSFFYKKAQIEAKRGRRAEAIAAAEKTIECLKASPVHDEPAIRNTQMLLDTLR